MTKKFDVVIGNPPYQEEAVGKATNQMPIYHLFMDAAHEVGDKAVLITPARFLFDAGYTPKAWNAKMLADPHLSVPSYVPHQRESVPFGGSAATTSWDQTPLRDLKLRYPRRMAQERSERLWQGQQYSALVKP